MGLRLSGPGATQLNNAFARLVGVQATVSADGALVAGAHNPVDATSGNRTVNLADAPSAGLLVAVSKKDASTNTVTVSVAHLRDGGAGTITLAGQYEALLLTSKADGTWWPVADHKTKAYLDGAYVGKATALSAGGVNVVASPSAQVGAGSDVVTVFGGTTSFPHILDAGSSLTTIPGGYDNHNRTYPGAGSPAIMSVLLGAHHVVGAAGGHGSIGGGSYGSVWGDYGGVGAGTQNSVFGAYGRVGGGRSNNAGAISKSTVATTAISVGDSSFTVGTVTGKAIVSGMTVAVDFGNKVELFLNVTVSGSTVTLPAGSTFARAHAIGIQVYFIDGTGTDATVGGGQANDAHALQSTVGGGFNNKARGTASTVAGGTGNIAGTSTAANATVGGGSGNVASAAGSTVAGGVSNTANGTNAVVAGGTLNTASATGSGVTHGTTNTASASYALAGGNGAVADHYGEQAFASGAFTTNGDAQASNLLARCVITGANTGELFLDQTSARLTLADNTAYRYVIETTAYIRGSSSTAPNTIAGMWTTKGGIYRKTGAATTTMFSNSPAPDSANIAGFDFAVSADTTNGSLKLLGTCIASYSVFFESRLALTKVSG